MNTKFTRSKFIVSSISVFFLLFLGCQKDEDNAPEEEESLAYDYVVEAKVEHDRSKKGIYRGIIRNKHGYGQFKVNFMNDSEKAYVVVFYEGKLDTLKPNNLMQNPDELPFDVPTYFEGERFNGHFRLEKEGRNPSMQIFFQSVYQGVPVTDHPVFLGSVAKERSDLKIFPLKGTFSVDEGGDNFLPGTFDGIMLDQADPAVYKYSFRGVMMSEGAIHGYLLSANLSGYTYTKPTQGPTGTVVSALFNPPYFTGAWQQERISVSGKWEAKVIEWF